MAFTFISGATGGIGKAFAFSCAKKGYDLFLTARSLDKLQALKSQLNAEFPKVNIEICPCEMTDDLSRKTMLIFIKGKDIFFDRIINVAGADIQKAFKEYTYEKLLFQIRVNCESTALVTRMLLERKEKDTELITIGSMSGVTPMPFFAVYSASKAFLESLFISLHYELKKEGVKVTVVLPGGVPTRPDVIDAIKKQGLWGKLSAKSPAFVAEKSLNAVKKNKLRYVPGFFNNFLYFTMKLIPLRWQLRFIARRWSKLCKDAF